MRLQDIFLLSLFLSRTGCSTLQPGFDAARALTPETRWIVVERNAGELFPETGNSLTRIAHESVFIAFERVPVGSLHSLPEVKGDTHHVEVIDIIPPGDVAPGEQVTVRVRVSGAQPGVEYWVSAMPVPGTVQLLDEPTKLVLGNATAAFRFTCLAGGRAAVRIHVRQCGRSFE